MNELKPCPFCGGTASYDYVMIRNELFQKVKCDRCKAQTNIYKEDSSAAAEAWNRRTKHE